VAESTAQEMKEIGEEYPRNKESGRKGEIVVTERDD
jgi:hypothetical protein